MGVRYRVMGGPSHCCGVLQFRAGDLATSGRIAYRTIERLAGAVGGRALTWCPTCQVQLGEVVAPGKTDTALDLQPFLLFLAERLDDLRPLLTPSGGEARRPARTSGRGRRQPRRREAILRSHSGTGFRRPGAAARRLHVQHAERRCRSSSARCTAPSCRRRPRPGVTTLAGIYHACHRELCSHERDWPFEVVNFLELVGESMGLTRPDLFKRLKLMQDVDAVLADAAPMIGREPGSIWMRRARSC